MSLRLDQLHWRLRRLRDFTAQVFSHRLQLGFSGVIKRAAKKKFAREQRRYDSVISLSWTS
jgi:hypothetical protein